MSLIYAPAERNLVGRGPGTLTTTSEDALFPEANLYDNQPGRPFRFASAAADVILKKDINAITNPGFETASLSGWTDADLGTGTSAETSTGAEVHAGTKACELVGTDTSNYGARYQDVTVYAGEKWKLDAWAIAIAAGTAKVFIRNLNTGNYLTTGSAWQASSTHCATSTSTSYTNITNTFTVETFEAAQQNEMTLRITLYCDTGNVAFDDVLLLPGVNLTSFHGHNMGPIAPAFASSDDDSAYTTRVSPTLRRPAFYGLDATTRYHRYWRVTLTGTNTAAIYIGEWFLGYGITPTLTQKYGWSTRWAFEQLRHATAAGESFRYTVSSDPARAFDFDFQPVSDTERQELLNDIFRVTRGGEMPLVVIPYSGETDVAMGLIRSEVDTSRDTLQVSQGGLTLEELPLPVVGL